MKMYKLSTQKYNYFIFKENFLQKKYHKQLNKNNYVQL